MKKITVFENYESERMKQVARNCKPGSVLDIGHAQNPNPYFSKNRHRTGIDIRVSTKYCHYEEELKGDATKLEEKIPGRRFDNIVAGEFIEHIENPYLFLRSLHPFLMPDGRLILTTPNPVAWPCVFFEWLMNQRFYYSQDHKYYFSPRWVKRILETTGYSVIKIQGVGILLPWIKLPSPAGLSYQVVYVAKSTSYPNDLDNK